MAVLLSAVTGAVDKAVRQELEQNEHYQDAKLDLEEEAQRAATVEKVSIVVGLSAIFGLTIFAFKYFESGRAVLGGVVMAGTVPVSILSYDCYQASENFRSQVYENPTELMVLPIRNRQVPINQIALRKCLLKGTIGFEPFLEVYKLTCMNNRIEED